MTRHSDEIAARARIVRPQPQPPMARQIYPAQRVPPTASGISAPVDDPASSAASSSTSRRP